MIMAWLTYCLLVSALLGGAAWVAERALRAHGWPGRWPWALALAGSVGLPLGAWLRPAPAPDPGAVAVLPMPGAYVMEAIPLAFQPAATAGPSPELLAVGLWAAVSAGLLLYLVVTALRIRAEGRRWRRRELEGVEVLVSEATGPAALGVFRGRVVLPEWALALDERLRRLLVLHEAEHVRARDPQLALAGLVTCALMPWNLPLWWQLAQLRLAIEMDCDGRVLRRSRDMAGYGSLLLEVGQRRRARLAVGLAESRSMLERRIRMITKTQTGRRTARALALGAVSVLVLAVACETPAPTGIADEASRPAEAEQAQDQDEARVATTVDPTFTPFTVPPRLQNPTEVQEALQRHYPPLLRDAGIGGVANVWFFIDETGSVRDARLNRTSGYEALDEAALGVAPVMKFSPARNRGEIVPVWISLEISFEVP